MRIAKFLSAAGICSRRDGERMIDARRVEVNGEVLTSPAFNIADGDQVCVDGKDIAAPQDARLWLYHKPVGLVTTHKDEHGRRTVFDEISEMGLPRVVSVGRLDLSSEGLLLLTNSGEIARKLELPSNKFDRIYRVRAYGDPAKLLGKGLKFHVEGVDYSFKALEIESDKSTISKATNHWFQVVLQEGKNREIRRVFAHFDLKVNRLIRTEYAGYTLGKLRRGEVREVKRLDRIMSKS